MVYTRNDDKSESKDSARTPPAIFKLLDDRFHFNIDLAASIDNALCNRFHFVSETNPLGFLNPEIHLTDKDIAFCNHPYAPGMTAAFQKKFWEETRDTSCTIVNLCVADTSTKAFAEYVMGWDLKNHCLKDHAASEVIFLTPRIHFLNADGSDQKSPQFGSMAVVWKKETFDGSPVISILQHSVNRTPK